MWINFSKCFRKKDHLQNTSNLEDLLKDDTNKIHYLESLVTKQLDLYNWCEEKVSTLATIDSILLGAAILFIEKVMNIGASATCCDKIINILIILLVLIPLFFSLAIALWHIRPKMGNASNTGRPNHRSSNGIRHFMNATHYGESFGKLTNDEIIEDLTKQIYGMNNNIWKNQQSIKTAVLLDVIGLFGFIIMIIYWSIF